MIRLRWDKSQPGFLTQNHGRARLSCAYLNAFESLREQVYPQINPHSLPPKKKEKWEIGLQASAPWRGWTVCNERGRASQQLRKPPLSFDYAEMKGSTERKRKKATLTD